VNVAFLATTACLAHLPAQDVVLSEVRADADGRWIELHNRSDSAVNLSTWSLHYATRTPSMPQNYWWPFPVGTVIAAGGHLRVHWFQAAPPTIGTGEVYTGDTHWDFLFSLGGETLRADRGALGLVRTQSESMMATPSMIEDWVSWGDHGFSREYLAVANGRWTTGTHTASIPAGGSLARNVAAIGEGQHSAQWFLDNTPTPLAPNLSGAEVAPYGQGCAPFGHHLLGTPVLSTSSLPIAGNASFSLRVDRTTGIYGEYVLLAWSAAPAAPGQPVVLPSTPGGCSLSLDVTRLITIWLLPAQTNRTTAPLSLAQLPPELIDSQVHAQAVVIDLLPYAYPPYQGVSNALRIVFGE
jgi:hypothetical protein